MDFVPSPAATPELTVVIKALNEAEKIGACIRSVLAVTDPATTEIIVADSLSEDATVAIAAQFPVRVVQLARREDRGCGTAAQLGFQHARGKRLLLLDGDMELDPGFLPAAARALDADPSLAGVGGLVIDRVMTLEFQRRAAAASPSLKPGYHKHLAGGGLFRMDAVRRSGYFADRNLHAYEELELGTRLSAEGWRLLRLDLPAVHHHGHAMPAARLLWHRWRTRYVLGQGELMRAVWGTDRRWRVARGALYNFVAIAWWIAVLAGLANLILRDTSWPAAALLLLILVAPIVIQSVRKRSLTMGVYSAALINLHGLGFVVGLSRPRIDPTTPIASVVLHEPEKATGG
jgi:glycosyltransferase involved in cell wall biosynthesis